MECRRNLVFFVLRPTALRAVAVVLFALSGALPSSAAHAPAKRHSDAAKGTPASSTRSLQRAHERAYQLVGRREDGLAQTIAVKGGRWVETTTAGDLVARLIVDRTHAVRYGLFGDVYVADRHATKAFQIRAALLSGSLSRPTSSQTLPGSRGRGSTTYEEYRQPDAIPLELTRVNGTLSEASMDAWFAFRSFGFDASGVITRWSSASRDGFSGVLVANVPDDAVFAEPSPPAFEDGDPTIATLDGRPVRVFVDTGTEGFGVSPAIAANATPVPGTIGVTGVAGWGSEGLVRFDAFQQLGVTRNGQIARVTTVIPKGYDAIEGIGMLPRLALHLDRDNAIVADHRGCRTGVSFSTWAGVVTAIVRVRDAPIPFNGWALFDTGLDGRAVQVIYPPLLERLRGKAGIVDDTYVGTGGQTNARCTARAVRFHMNGLSDVARPLCYVADALVGTAGPAVHSSLVVNPVAFLGRATTIDDEHKLIC